MINVTPQLITALQETGLKVYDENFMDQKSDIPCISIREYNNSSYILVDILEYSRIVYHIKVWAKTEKDLVDYSAKVDEIMRNQWFKRTNMTELWVDNIGQRDLKYEALGLERF